MVYKWTRNSYWHGTTICNLPYLKQTVRTLKHWGWKMSFLFGFRPPGTCYVCFGGVYSSKWNITCGDGYISLKMDEVYMWSDTSYRCKTFPWKSKTIKIIVPNLGWWKFPIKNNRLWWKPILLMVFGLLGIPNVQHEGPLGPGEEALKTLHKRLLFTGVHRIFRDVTHGIHGTGIFT